MTTLAEIARTLTSGRVDPRLYPGALAGLIPVDLVLSLAAKRDYRLYRLWQRYQEASKSLFDETAPAASAPVDPAILATLRARGIVKLPAYPASDVSAALAWVEERAAAAVDKAAREIDPQAKVDQLYWDEGRTRMHLDRRTSRMRLYLDAADPERASWPHAIRDFFDVPSVHALAQEYFGTHAIFPTQPYMMAEVLTRGPQIEPWHIDCVRQSVKAFLFLTDVGPANGPLRTQVGSHALDDRRHEWLYKICNGGLGHAYFSEEDNARLDATATTHLGPAGTLVVFDTQSLHASSFCSEGRRVVLVNGYRPATTLRLNPRLFRDPRPVPHPWEK